MWEKSQLLPDCPTLCEKVERLSVHPSICVHISSYFSGFFRYESRSETIAIKIKNNLITDKALAVYVPVACYCEFPIPVSTLDWEYFDHLSYYQHSKYTKIMLQGFG